MRFHHIVDAAKAQLTRAINDRPELGAFVSDPLDIPQTLRGPLNLSAVVEVVKRIECLQFRAIISGQATHYARDAAQIKALRDREARYAIAEALVPHFAMTESVEPHDRFYKEIIGDTQLRGELWFIKKPETK